ncbi:MAG: hypothetical protein VKJ06_00290 [Vampirovibrionales bacterium]|nr:hypothetical protein [Vampirovibrionales bacterium]
MSDIDFTLYNILVSQLAEQLDEQPDLTIVQHKKHVPDAWPLVLTGITSYRKQIRYFTVSDGKTSVPCYGCVPDEVYERVMHLEPGAIVHLMGAEPRYNADHNGYVLDVQDVMTLKAYENYLNDLRMRESQRMARMQMANAFEPSAYEY